MRIIVCVRCPGRQHRPLGAFFSANPSLCPLLFRAFKAQVSGVTADPCQQSKGTDGYVQVTISLLPHVVHTFSKKRDERCDRRFICHLHDLDAQPRGVRLLHK